MSSSRFVGLIFTLCLLAPLRVHADAPAGKAACPAGQHWDSGMNMCMPDGPSTPQPTYTWFRSSIISQRCLMCHSTTQGDGDGLGKANFDTYEGVLKTVQPGDPVNSTLYNALLNKKMPRPMDGQATAPYLNDAELSAVRDWITQGADED